MAYTTLINDIVSTIKVNGNEEITGGVMQSALLDMVNTLGEGFQYMGICTPLTNTSSLVDEKVFYIALTEGQYNNMGGYTHDGSIGVFSYDGSGWSYDKLLAAIDDEPTAGSDNLVKSGGVFSAIKNVEDGIDVIREDLYGVEIAQPTANDVLDAHLDTIGGWQNGGYSLMIGLSGLQGKHITSTGGTQYAFVKTFTDTSTNVIFADDCGRESGKPSNELIPNDANYLYIFLGFSQGTLPTLALTESTKGIKETVDDLSSDMASLQGEVEPLTYLTDVADGFSYAYLVDKTQGQVAELSNPIVLQDNGDSIEFTILNVTEFDAQNNIYAFAYKGGNPNAACIGVGGNSLTRKFALRADDDTWIFVRTSPSIGHTFKVSYENDNIVLYVDGIAESTYEGQKTTTIGGFGKYSSYYWGGRFCNLKVNGVKYDLESESSTFDFSKSIYGTCLTEEEQAEIQLAIPRPDVVVNKDSTYVDVYVNINDVDYLMVRLKNQKSDILYYDVWQIYQLFAVTLNDGIFTLGDTLFASGVSELAISVTSQQDVSGYVGGTHGRDMIIEENNERQVLMLIDGLPLSETGTTTMTSCSRFEIYTHEYLYEPGTTEDPWAEVMKHWEFTKGQVKITPTVKTYRSIAITHGQFGMMCIFRRWEGDTSNNYLTSRAFKSNLPFAVYNIEDGWDVGHPENAPLKQKDRNCTQLQMWGDRGYAVSFETPHDNRKENGGVYVATNAGTYNKVYFDLTGNYQTSANETLYGTQVWTWNKTDV